MRVNLVGVDDYEEREYFVGEYDLDDLRIGVHRGDGHIMLLNKAYPDPLQVVCYRIGNDYGWPAVWEVVDCEVDNPLWTKSFGRMLLLPFA